MGLIKKQLFMQMEKLKPSIEKQEWMIKKYSAPQEEEVQQKTS